MAPYAAISLSASGVPGAGWLFSSCQSRNRYFDIDGPPRVVRSPARPLIHTTRRGGENRQAVLQIRTSFWRDAVPSSWRPYRDERGVSLTDPSSTTRCLLA